MQCTISPPQAGVTLPPVQESSDVFGTHDSSAGMQPRILQCPGHFPTMPSQQLSRYADHRSRAGVMTHSYQGQTLTVLCDAVAGEGDCNLQARHALQGDRRRHQHALRHTRRQCCPHLLWAWHRLPLPLRAQHTSLQRQQGAALCLLLLHACRWTSAIMKSAHPPRAVCESQDMPALFLAFVNVALRICS